MNYKSLECYQRFIAGWVREILISVQGETRVLTSKQARRQGGVRGDVNESPF